MSAHPAIPAPELLVLGVGNSESMRFWNASLLVQTAAGNLLIDCGPTFKYALRDVGRTAADVDAVYITHLHGDHIHGLERLGYESRYGFNKRVRLLLEPPLVTPLWDSCLCGSMGMSSSGRNCLEDFFEVSVVKDHAFAFGRCSFRSFGTRHTPGMDSFGLIIADRVIYTSDSRAMPELVERARDATLVIHDFSVQDEHPVHATRRALVATYPSWLRQRMLLIHYEDTVPELAGELERDFLGLARQGQRVPLVSCL